MIQDYLKTFKPYHILGEKFHGAPAYISLAEASPYFDEFATATQEQINALLQKIQAEKGATWSVSGDREHRAALYANQGYNMTEAAIHVGVDVIAPAGIPIYAPFDSEVASVSYDGMRGGYGWTAVLKCPEFYLLFGHLARENLAQVGTKLKGGNTFARIGETHENGNWFHHTHMQVLTDEAYNKHYFSALVRPNEMKFADYYHPSPMPIILAGIKQEKGIPLFNGLNNHKSIEDQ